jgi:hypothetical protein
VAADEEEETNHPPISQIEGSGSKPTDLGTTVATSKSISMPDLFT